MSDSEHVIEPSTTSGPDIVEDERKEEKGVSEMDSLEWKKMCRVIAGSGFREGALAGKSAAFQTGFEHGYAVGYRNALVLGHLKALSRLPGKEKEENAESPISELTKTSKGCCHICATKDDSESSEVKHQSLTDLITNQRNFTQNVLKSIQSKNADIIKKCNVLLPHNTPTQGTE